MTFFLLYLWLSGIKIQHRFNWLFEFFFHWKKLQIFETCKSPSQKAILLSKEVKLFLPGITFIWLRKTFIKFFYNDFSLSLKIKWFLQRTKVFQQYLRVIQMDQNLSMKYVKEPFESFSWKEKCFLFKMKPQNFFSILSKGFSQQFFIQKPAVSLIMSGHNWLLERKLKTLK